MFMMSTITSNDKYHFVIIIWQLNDYRYHHYYNYNIYYDINDNSIIVHITDNSS